MRSDGKVTYVMADILLVMVVSCLWTTCERVDIGCLSVTKLVLLKLTIIRNH